MPNTLKCLYQGQPLAITPPNNATFTTATTGGTLAATTANYYQVTAVVNGAETLPSAETSITTGSGSTNSNTVIWSAVVGATAYNVYGRATGSGKVRIGQVTTGATSFVDTGAAGTGQALPSTTTLAEATATPGIYTPPTGKTALVLGVIVSNPGIVAGQVFLSRVTSGGTGGASSRLLGGVTVAPDSQNQRAPYEWVTKVPLGAGEFLTGYLSYNAMVITVNGVELG